MQLVVARIGKAHGLRGEVTVQLHTDAPQQRFAPGVVLDTEPASTGPLTVRSVRDHNGITLLAFEQAPDRTGAQRLRGTRLLAEARDGRQGQPDEDAWYEAELTGLAVLLTDGTEVGVVTGLEPRAVQDLLVLELTDGRRARVPLVAELVPEVDIAAGRVVIDPPAGLLDLDEG